MPQMKPSMWIIIMIMVNTIMMMMMMIIYFQPEIKSKKISKTPQIFIMNTKWK